MKYRSVIAQGRICQDAVRGGLPRHRLPAQPLCTSHQYDLCTTHAPMEQFFAKSNSSLVLGESHQSTNDEGLPCHALRYTHGKQAEPAAGSCSPDGRTRLLATGNRCISAWRDEVADPYARPLPLRRRNTAHQTSIEIEQILKGSCRPLRWRMFAACLESATSDQFNLALLVKGDSPALPEADRGRFDADCAGRIALRLEVFYEFLECHSADIVGTPKAELQELFLVCLLSVAGQLPYA